MTTAFVRASCIPLLLYDCCQHHVADVLCFFLDAPPPVDVSPRAPVSSRRSRRWAERPSESPFGTSNMTKRADFFPTLHSDALDRLLAFKGSPLGFLCRRHCVDFSSYIAVFPKGAQKVCRFPTFYYVDETRGGPVHL